MHTHCLSIRRLCTATHHLYTTILLRLRGRAYTILQHATILIGDRATTIITI